MEQERTYDILIIGGGAVGCAAARELARYRLSIALVERCADVAAGASGRNSAVVHAGFNNPPGSLMAQLCVEGNRGFEALCRELDVPYKKTGKLLVAFDLEDMATLLRLHTQGERSGCQGLELMGEETLHALLPQVGGIGAMRSPETGIFDPFLYTVALAENAQANGVDFFLRHEVTALEALPEGGFAVTAGGKVFHSRFVVNCAGLNCAKIAALAGIDRYHIYPCRGEYFILDQGAAQLPMPVYPVPRAGEGGLGVHLTPTVHGNLLIGPSAEYSEDPQDVSSTREVMDKLLQEAAQLLPGLNPRKIIGAYCGLRPKQTPPGEGGYRDFIIRAEPSRPGLINLIGIESPGMTASLPIARGVVGLIGQAMDLEEREDFNPQRRGIPRFRDKNAQEQAVLIARDPDFGEVVCRCQKVTRGELRRAVENPLGVRTVSGIKYRAWATTGRCGGGYCLPRLAQMLVSEYGLEPEEVYYREENSPLFAGRVK